MKLSKHITNTNKPIQGRENTMFLNKLMRRKRGRRDIRTILRKYKLFFKITVILVTAVILGGKASEYISNREILKIKQVVITGASTYVNYNDVKCLAEENSLGENILTFNTDDLRDKLKNNFLGAYEITVQKDYFNMIKVNIEERIPLAVLYSSTLDKRFIIDAEGYVLGEVASGTIYLPEVIYEKDIMIGTFVEKDIVPLTTELIELAGREDIEISSMSFYPKYLKIWTENNTSVYIPNNKINDLSLKVISSLTRNPNPEDKKISKIDLRYDKVIVSYD